MKSSRRKFIAMAGFAALGWSVCPSLTRAATEAGPKLYFKEEGSLEASQWAMAIDTKKLDRQIMNKCIEACHTLHNVPDIDSDQNIKWIWIEPFRNLFYDQSHPNLKNKANQPFLTLCNHCDNPPCVRVCPTRATFRRPDGIVLMDFHRCIGCRFCMAGCPYGSRSFNFYDPRIYLENLSHEYPTRSKGVVEKCEFCAHRLDKGQMPACVEASEGALLFGDLNDSNSDVRKALRERYSLVRKPKLGTGPKVYYLI
ncbi:sulfate reduction electron transfer complex DsrMKJOP subunit DsrO [Desulfonatronovibrio magnus]|uniref:sulfate reduction electron transfer complex DsrMKJOP subunit DsrO n=1 Tax=Desulfonatronovibrio magnus TaxID=698827 RepID=UPI0005EAE225|nr:4Fe-4S dicluster domain-containing protein [Desulfonatronovibrio magnus]RQD61820.1 MAG: 4Fe-4S dicluster domain-containing protein [Desulfonatronovibrio sp. MSAO_Bac4]